MDSYDKMENEMQTFKKYLKMTNDLLCDSYKWKKLSEYSEDAEAQEKYKKISDTLFDMFMTEHNSIGAMFKGEE